MIYYRRKERFPNDIRGVDEETKAGGDAGGDFLSLYDQALPYVYGYLLSRCGERALAEDLTSETMLAAVDSTHRESPSKVSTGWLVGIARHKLVDHWRRQALEERRLRSVPGSEVKQEEPWDAQLDSLQIRQTLSRISPQYRAALTLRYIDDLPVAEVAAHLDRTLHATETLLARARAAFKDEYVAGGPDD